jgi:hypothetical protein
MSRTTHHAPTVTPWTHSVGVGPLDGRGEVGLPHAVLGEEQEVEEEVAHAVPASARNQILQEEEQGTQATATTMC